MKHPLHDQILALRAKGLTKKRIAQTLGVTIGVVNGITYRHDNPPPAPAGGDRGPSDWDRKTFETWSERKARLAKERRTAHGHQGH